MSCLSTFPFWSFYPWTSLQILCSSSIIMFALSAGFHSRQNRPILFPYFRYAVSSTIILSPWSELPCEPSHWTVSKVGASNLALTLVNDKNIVKYMGQPSTLKYFKKLVYYVISLVVTMNSMVESKYPVGVEVHSQWLCSRWRNDQQHHRPALISAGRAQHPGPLRERLFEGRSNQGLLPSLLLWGDSAG